MKPTPITVAHGDGIGPEIMRATLAVLRAADAPILPEAIVIGKTAYESGHTSGISPDAWDSIRRTGVLLKAPITTPQGGGYKSLNVTLRKSLGLYANVRPVRAYTPFVPTNHPDIHLTIVRENEEDLYAGIEHRQTDDVMQCLKLITRPGCERIMRYAFEFARAGNHRRVTCMTKDNIMKMTDGLFHQIFRDMAKEYPNIETDHQIIDIGAARLADTPENFDIIVTPNLYGDIISDIAAQIAGSVGLAPSANIGAGGAMFEAIHGSAPDIAGQNRANPSGLLLAAVMMLHHIGASECALQIHNAWLCTMEEKVHTADIYKDGTSAVCVGTSDFAEAVIARLGKMPKTLAPARVSGAPMRLPQPAPAPRAKKDLVGVDVFLHWNGGTPDELANVLCEIHSESLTLRMITNRGVKVWPQGISETFCTDHWRCRFTATTGDGIIRHSDIVSLLAKVTGVGLDFIKCENLCLFDGVPGYAKGQGE